MTVADRIKETRIEKDMSQLDLAKKCGYSDRTSISKVEASGNDITMKKLERIANALDVSCAYLMGWEDKTGEIIKEQKSNEPSEADIIVELYRNSDASTKESVKRILRYNEMILKALRGK